MNDKWVNIKRAIEKIMMREIIPNKSPLSSHISKFEKTRLKEREIEYYLILMI